MVNGEKDSWRGPSAVSWVFGFVVGIGVGIALGVAMGNPGVGIAIGVSLGVAFALVFSEGERRERNGRRAARGDQPRG